jgi:hypothetical protein
MINNIQIKPSKTIFDNDVQETINGYKAQKYSFKIDYTSKT